MQQPILFASPIWKFSEPVPEGAEEWALEYKKANASVEYSNRGGYQSNQNYNFNTFPYHEHVRNMLGQFTPFNEFMIEGWWLNVNEKGDYNLPHTHPGTDLAAVWYFTDIKRLLYFQDPLIQNRSNLYTNIFSQFGEKANKAFECKEGDLIVFPSDVPHSVEQHQLDTPRISVAFNMLVNALPGGGLIQH